jgi:hypothetical protein
MSWLKHSKKTYIDILNASSSLSKNQNEKYIDAVNASFAPESKKGLEEQWSRLGLIIRLVYHCNRCNYCWLPRDYDTAYDDIVKMKPPKACARCKSKYWRNAPQRKTLNFAGPNSSAREMRLLMSGKVKIPGVIYSKK